MCQSCAKRVERRHGMLAVTQILSIHLRSEALLEKYTLANVHMYTIVGAALQLHSEPSDQVRSCMRSKHRSPWCAAVPRTLLMASVSLAASV